MGVLGTPLVKAFAQGVSSRGVKAQPRGKPSGLPFDASFVDIAAQAGLRAPLIYGAPGKENLHCRNGRLRLRLFRLRQRRLAGYFSAGRHAARRRSGRGDESPVQEQSRRHIYGCHGESRLAEDRLAFRRDRGRFQQRRL